MEIISRYVQLRPHGDRLLTSSAGFWLLSVRVLILAMASAEGIAWSYLGYLFGSGAGRWLTALFAGGLMFLVVWIVDTSLVTLDRAWNDHAKSILGLKTASAMNVLLHDVFRFGVRIGLLVASLTVTSPYLALVVFHKDIQQQIDADAVARIGEARDHLAKKYDSQIAGIGQQIGQKRTEHDDEVAGTGRSRRYGVGPAAQAMLDDLAILEGQRDDLRREKSEALAEFNSRAQHWADNRVELSALYGVSLPEASILQNRKVLDELRKRPENQSTELAIRVFLGIIFFGLLLLKVFEPSSVRLYLSEVLQQEYDRYLSGTFNAMLPETERSDAPRPSMPPQRLYDFLTRIWVPASTHPQTIAAAKSLSLLENLRQQIDNEVSQTKSEVQRVCGSADEAERSLTELKSAIGSVGADLAEFRAKLGALSQQDNALDEQARAEFQSYLRRSIAKAELTLHELREALPNEMEKHRRASEAVTQVEKKLKEKDSELVATQQKIREVRGLLSNAVGNAAQAVLSASAG